MDNTQHCLHLAILPEEGTTNTYLSSNNTSLRAKNHCQTKKKQEVSRFLVHLAPSKIFKALHTLLRVVLALTIPTVSLLNLEIQQVWGLS